MSENSSQVMVSEVTASRPSEVAPTGATHLRLALVTPARNEAAHIEQTILSVIKQSVRPIKWIIVSDGSTDGTNDIVAKYDSSHPWIEGVYLPERTERHFAAKVHAFNAGYEDSRA